LVGGVESRGPTFAFSSLINPKTVEELVRPIWFILNSGLWHAEPWATALAAASLADEIELTKSRDVLPHSG
jgi:hypothetical protein